MPRRPALLAALAAVALAAACQKDDAGKVKELETKLAAMDQRLAKLEGFLKPYLDQPPPPPEPDPAATYAVPIEGAPVKGPAGAPVTIVEAFEFA